MENFGVSRNESVLSVLSESGIYVLGLVNHRLMCILLALVLLSVCWVRVRGKKWNCFKTGANCWKTYYSRWQWADCSGRNWSANSYGKDWMLLACYNSARFSPRLCARFRFLLALSVSNSLWHRNSCSRRFETSNQIPQGYTKCL